MVGRYMYGPISLSGAGCYQPRVHIKGGLIEWRKGFHNGYDLVWEPTWRGGYKGIESLSVFIHDAEDIQRLDGVFITSELPMVSSLLKFQGYKGTIVPEDPHNPPDRVPQSIVPEGGYTPGQTGTQYPSSNSGREKVVTGHPDLLSNQDQDNDPDTFSPGETGDHKDAPGKSQAFKGQYVDMVSGRDKSEKNFPNGTVIINGRLYLPNSFEINGQPKSYFEYTPTTRFSRDESLLSLDPDYGESWRFNGVVKAKELPVQVTSEPDKGTSDHVRVISQETRGSSTYTSYSSGSSSVTTGSYTSYTPAAGSVPSQAGRDAQSYAGYAQSTWGGGKK